MGRFQEWLQRELRRLHFRHQPRKDALADARVKRGQYKCAHCGHIFGPKEIDIDHVEPVVNPATGFKGWDEYVNRLFVSKEGYQVLCKECHKQKSKEENETRW